MFRFFSITVAVGTLAACVWGGGPEPAPAEVERARCLQRDQELIETLVDSGLALAGQDDPLERAAQCNKLADSLAKEIRHAGVDRDGARVAELGRHLRVVLESGVADNLRVARSAIARGSPRERTLLEFSTLVKDVEAQLRQVPHTEARQMDPALDAARQGLKEVENAIQGKKKN